MSAAAPEASAVPPRPPLWVRLVDVVSIAALALAVSVLLFGGFRVMVGGTRVSVTDWWRPALWSLALMAVRQWRWPDDPAWRRAARAIARWEDDGGRVLDLEQAGAVRATFGRTRVSQAAGWLSA